MKKQSLKQGLKKSLAPPKPRPDFGLIDLIEEHKGLYSEEVVKRALDHLSNHIRRILNNE